MSHSLEVASKEPRPLVIRYLGRQDYQPTWQAMLDFTDQRDNSTEDELWFVEHPPVFTQGQAGKAEHLLAPGEIPVVQVDRGGQVTYHGPGQSVVYFMLNLRRRGLGVRELVTGIEQSVVSMLNQFEVSAQPRADAPGVYVDSGAKICSLGLRIRKGCSLHGLALNVDMDLSPFGRINPCGLVGISVTDMASEGKKPTFERVNRVLLEQICRQLSYNVVAERKGLDGNE